MLNWVVAGLALIAAHAAHPIDTPGWQVFADGVVSLCALLGLLWSNQRMRPLPLIGFFAYWLLLSAVIANALPADALRSIGLWVPLTLLIRRVRPSTDGDELFLFALVLTGADLVPGVLPPELRVAASALIAVPAGITAVGILRQSGWGQPDLNRDITNPDTLLEILRPLSIRNLIARRYRTRELHTRRHRLVTFLGSLAPTIVILIATVVFFANVNRGSSTSMYFTLGSLLRLTPPVLVIMLFPSVVAGIVATIAVQHSRTGDLDLIRLTNLRESDVLWGYIGGGMTRLETWFQGFITAQALLAGWTVLAGIFFSTADARFDVGSLVAMLIGLVLGFVGMVLIGGAVGVTLGVTNRGLLATILAPALTTVISPVLPLLVGYALLSGGAPQERHYRVDQLIGQTPNMKDGEQGDI
ncbi:MAG: hypothetical protein ACFB51_05660, partial [Anaerolineae bacterium]